MKKNNTKTLKEKIISLEKALFQLDEKYKRIKLAYERGALHIEEFTEDKRSIEDERQGFIHEIEKTNINLIKEEKIANQSEHALSALADFDKSWSTAEFTDKKELLQMLLEKIIVKDNDIQLYFSQSN